MREGAATDALLRQFLLGKVEDEARQRIEGLFLTDSDIRERVLGAEQELIDDYLEGCLPIADRETFISVYANTSAQRRRLRIAKSVFEWAVNHQHTIPISDVAATSGWGRLRARGRLKLVLVTPIGVTATIAIMVIAVFVNSRKTERYRYYLAVQQELTQLNTPSSQGEDLPQLTLRPGPLRSLDPQAELEIRPNTRIAELRLFWMRENYPIYQAVVRRSGDDQSYTVRNLTAENGGGKFIRVRLPAHLLTCGNYQIELSGVSGDSTTSPPEVYSFTVCE